MSLDLNSIMHELEALGTAHTKKSYVSRGVREPLFGVATGALKPLKKQIGTDQALADALWATGNYDAMYLAGMVADVSAMTEADFERWIDAAYGPMLSDFVVSVTLTESELAEVIANRWIRGDDETRAAAGWSCYEWLLGWRPDSYFDPDTIGQLLELIVNTIHTSAPHAKRTMNSCLVAIGVSYLPLHQQALDTADAVGVVEVAVDGVTKPLKSAAEQIRAAEAKGRLGFKRRAVRC